MKVIHRSDSHEWATPQWLLEELSGEYGPFDLDPAARAWSACAPRHYDLDQGEDGLRLPWEGRVFVNPPYGRGDIGISWQRKAWTEVRAGRAEVVVFLVPARTDTEWWHEFVMPRASEVVLVRGRLRFIPGPSTKHDAATFPSAVVVYRPGRLRGCPTFSTLDPCGRK